MRAGIPFSTKPGEPLALANEPTISLSKEVWNNALLMQDLLGGDPGANSTLAHEIFHSTVANNLADHNDREQIAFNESTACSQSIADDRININAELCTGSYKHFGGQTAAEGLFKRMAHCGIEKGCEEAFTSEIAGPKDSLTEQYQASIDAKFTPSRPLKKDQANLLCNLIQDDGACAHLRKTNFEGIFKLDTPLKKVGDKVAARIDDILPKTTNDIPGAVFKTFPELGKQAQELSDTPCFKAAFYPPPKGADGGLDFEKPLYLNLKDPHRVVEEERPAGALSTTRWSRFRDASDKMRTSSRCTDSAQREKVEKFLRGVEDTLVPAFEAKTYKVLAHPRFLGKPETQNNTGYIAESEKDGNEKFTKLLGKDLTKEYLEALDRFHPASPNFDCEAVGLSKFRSALGAKTKITSADGKTCP
jgi:hypothetical protein